MATQMAILSFGVIAALTVLTVLLPVPSKANVIDQRVLQRELGENSPEIISLSDKDDFRELEEPAINDYAIKTKSDDQVLENAFIDYLFAKQMLNKFRVRSGPDSIRAQKKRSYWKQCAFNAVSCFG